MASKLVVLLALIIGVCVMFTASLSAQRLELYPNAGGVFPQHNVIGGGFKGEGIYGLKGGVFATENIEIEGSFSYMSHFQLRHPTSVLNPAFGVMQPPVRGLFYDVNATYNFGERALFGNRISPYLTVGAGGLTAHLPDTTSTFVQGGFISTPTGIIPDPGQTKIMNDNDTFFTVNYGGGVKFLNVTGPLGFRVDLRARTLPNFFGQHTTWLEPTGGITLSWGEK